MITKLIAYICEFVIAFSFAAMVLSGFVVDNNRHVRILLRAITAILLALLILAYSWWTTVAH